jgi:hypothetical protein
MNKTPATIEERRAQIRSFGETAVGIDIRAIEAIG